MSTSDSNSNNSSQFTLRSILDKEKLDGTNFIEWFRLLRVVLRHEKKFYVLETPPPNVPVKNAPTEVITAYDKYEDDYLIVGCLMLATMTPELLRDHENMTAWYMISSLKSMFQLQIKRKIFDTFKALSACKMTERSSVSAHILKMKGYFDQLTRLGFPLGQELEIDMVLNSLSKTDKQFIKDYNMKDKGKGGIPEVAVWYNCFHHGHQMRTCPARLAEIKKQKATRVGPSGVKSWIRTVLRDEGSRRDKVLGIKIYRGRSKCLIRLSKSTYIDKILKHFKMKGSKKENLPIEHSVHLSETQSPSTKEDMNRMKGVPCVSANCSIMYSMLMY
ncbi:hypothetical protein L6452_43548 [Arctium lappa]|uniref:Uncharacterized protein n=1 Tax=Arctium lappa TaxID=4217 RepID=A0ACB8XEH2_ARCLA|nr:hypothetical protein L6452_43548 [Arctium lappa]